MMGQVKRHTIDLIKQGNRSEDDRKVLFALHQMDGIGWQSISKLIISLQGRLHLLLDKSYRKGLKLPLNEWRNERIAQLNEQLIDDQLALYRQYGIDVITIYDEHYPKLLREISQAPWVIYTRGNKNLLQQPTMAVVGTRTPTTYGRRMAERLAGELAAQNWCIVSGLARGIDSIAHASALQEIGKTIAVLGTGIDVVYPPEHGELYEKIAEQGLLLSEFPLHTQPKAGHFPMRNRIIAGLSYGTLVVEAAQRSGSLITALIALDENREVFALPGPISSPKSAGTLDLIQKNRAKLVTKVSDITEEFRYLHPLQAPPSDEVDPAKSLSEDERAVLSLLSFEPLSFDDMMEQSSFNFGHLHAVLLSLTINSYIEQLPGGAYVKVQ